MKWLINLQNDIYNNKLVVSAPPADTTMAFHVLTTYRSTRPPRQRPVCVLTAGRLGSPVQVEAQETVKGKDAGA